MLGFSVNNQRCSLRFGQVRSSAFDGVLDAIRLNLLRSKSRELLGVPIMKRSVVLEFLKVEFLGHRMNHANRL
jgi:hypothetical protein